MNKNDMGHPQTALSGQEYLLDLGRSLLFYFPLKQTAEILDDYQEYFLTEEENGNPEVNASLWGTPKDVLKALLDENPRAKTYCCRWSVFWGCVLLLSLFCLFHSGPGMLAAAFLLPLSFFGFIHGWSRIRLEADFPAAQKRSIKTLILPCIVPVLVFLLEAEMQLFVKNPGNIPPFLGNLPIGPVMDLEYAFFELLFFLWMIRMGKRMMTLSVQYLPGMVHAMGAVLFCMDLRNCLHSMNISIGTAEQALIRSLLFYGFGLVLGALFWLVIRVRSRIGRDRQRILPDRI